MPLNIESIQKDLRAAKLDGWLFYDFRGRDPIALRILRLPEGMRTRRWFYFVPRRARPKNWCTRSRRGACFAAWRHALLFRAGRVARQSEKDARPRKAHGHAVFAEELHPLYLAGGCRNDGAGSQRGRRSWSTSADLVQKFEACWSEEQLAIPSGGRARDR